MSSLFKIERPLNRSLSKLADLAVLNILWVISCIPIITIGGANIAMYTIIIRMNEEYGGRILKDYIRAFKENFLPGLLLEIFVVILGGVLVFDYTIISKDIADRNMGNAIKTGFDIIAVIMVITWLLISVMSFMIYARFETSIVGTVINAMLMGISELCFAIPAVIIEIIPIVMFLFLKKFFFYSLIIWLLFGVALLRYINMCILDRVFVKYMD